jgi:hypothetical protein
MIRRTIARYVVVAALALLALWAFVSYLEPGFTGDRAEALLICG